MRKVCYLILFKWMFGFTVERKNSHSSASTYRCNNFLLPRFQSRYKANILLAMLFFCSNYTLLLGEFHMLTSLFWKKNLNLLYEISWNFPYDKVLNLKNLLLTLISNFNNNNACLTFHKSMSLEILFEYKFTVANNY
jgi:hypothetical protein